MGDGGGEKAEVDPPPPPPPRGYVDEDVLDRQEECWHLTRGGYKKNVYGAKFENKIVASPWSVLIFKRNVFACKLTN